MYSVHYRVAVDVGDSALPYGDILASALAVWLRRFIHHFDCIGRHCRHSVAELIFEMADSGLGPCGLVVGLMPITRQTLIASSSQVHVQQRRYQLLHGQQSRLEANSILRPGLRSQLA